MMNTPPRHLILSVVSALLAVSAWVVAAPRPGGPQASPLDTAAIDRAIGKAGQSSGDVYKVTFPRWDLHVTVHGLAINPGLALTGWAAFKAVDAEAVTHGDLALTETEVNPVVGKLRAGGIEVTAIHNHLLGESPRVMYVHFWGRGPAPRLAASLKAALALTAAPMADAPPASGGQDVPGADQIQQTLGLRGAVNGGVLGLSKPRTEPITMMGVTLPPAMGMATSMNFQAAEPGKVAATGDFVLTGDEVNRVISALRDHGIDVTALHNHMIHGSPELYFMHFWADDTPARVAAGLKAALDAMGQAASGGRQEEP
jgi:biotin operon repressor